MKRSALDEKLCGPAGWGYNGVRFTLDKKDKHVVVHGSRRREYHHFADVPSPSLLLHLLKG